MGIAVSNWRLAKAVSRLGELGVVSGTLLAIVLARRLAEGDLEGHVRRALAHFPLEDVASRVLDNYFVDGGKAADAPFPAVPMPNLKPSKELTELTVAANFVEVFLAKEGHNGLVGINLLEKLQTSTLPSLYGAMLAGVDYVLMGAGIPRAIPGVLDRFSQGQPADLKVDVEGALPEEVNQSQFDPNAFFGRAAPTLKRPQFLAIVSSSVLATTLARKSTGRVDGFVVEGESAGGHNAPPRGSTLCSDRGEPVYGPRDIPDLGKIRELGLPFWIAGSQAGPETLADAKAVGAVGIQVGTAFAFCAESGMSTELKRLAVATSLTGGTDVFTNPKASPTGFPFKVLGSAGSLSDAGVYAARERVCDLGYLRELYRREDGTTGYRCPAEPIDAFVRKGGTEQAADGKICLCNGLLSAIGLNQVRDGQSEPPLVTAGRQAKDLGRFLPPGETSYHAENVLQVCRGQAPTRVST